MITKSLKHLALSGLAMVALPFAARAAAITLPGLAGYTRSATLDSATIGYFGEGNATTATVETRTGLDWTAAGDVSGTEGTSGLLSDDYLSVNLTSGTWGSRQVSGTWEISATFWSIFADAAISLHGGNGNGSPDYFVWIIEQGQTSGTWSYDGGQRGGGLSNLHLYGTGEGTRVPDSSSTFALLALGLASLGLIARRRTA